MAYPPVVVSDAPLPPAELDPALPVRFAPGAAPPAPPRLDAGAILLRYKWVLLACTLLGALAGLAAARVVRPLYAANGTIWIETSDGNGPAQGPIRSAQLLRSYAWVELLKSYAVMDSVVAAERLYVRPAASVDAPLFRTFGLQERFVPGRYSLAVGTDGRQWILSRDAGMEVERGNAGADVGRRVGFAWRPDLRQRHGKTIEFTVLNPRDVARGLAERVETRMGEDGHFLGLTLTGTDPAEAASTLNTLMARYVQVAAQLKRARLDELTRILEEQRRYSEENLRAAEIALEGFRVRTVTLPSQVGAPVIAGIEMTRDPVFSSFFEKQVAREDLRRDREALERIVEQSARGQIGYDALGVVPAVQQNPELMQLLTERTTRRAELRSLQSRYTDEHPPVQRLQEGLATSETVTIPTAVRALARQIAARESELDRQIQSASSELRRIPPRAIEETRLERRVEIANALYGTLRQRYEEARLAAVSSLPDLRVLDPATTPSAPVKDRRALLVLGFSGGGFALSLLVALLLSRLDRRVRYPEQVATTTGLPLLAVIPTTRGGFSANGLDGVAMSEAFRELRLALMHGQEGPAPFTIAVASASRGDGKSTISAGLARALAGQGHRTLLIDADTRRGSLHRLLGVRRTPGLTDCLEGRVPLADCLQVAPGLGFTVLPSGTRMHRAPELLGSPAMVQLLEELRRRYSVVVVDTPPLAAGADAYLLGTLTRNMLLVLRTGATDMTLTEAKLSLLDRLPVHIVGAVLNAAPASREYRYYQYLPGYEALDEAAAPEPVAP